jgi:stress-induced-phosphoprotein 1
MSGFKEQGNEAFKQKDYKAAISFYTQALETAPSDHTILGNRAAAYHNLGQYNEAESDADECISIKPDWSKGFQRKAMAQQAKGDLDQAMENYQKGVDLDPSNAQCKQMLEQAEAQLMQRMMGGMGGMGGMPGMGGMGGGMPGMGGDGPFSAAALAKLKTNPKIAKYFEDPKFKNLFELCQ